MNHRYALIACIALALTFAGQANAQDPAEPKLLSSDEIVWVDNPLRPGAQMATMEGDLTKPGPLTVRFKFPANFTVPPHWHPNGERFIILSGSMLEGIGEDGDMSKAKLLTAGSMGLFPAKTPHYVQTKEEVVIQVFTTGPLQTFPVKK